MKNESEKRKESFFAIPEYFFDYGLQCFTHIEYDILAYILRNIIGWKDGRKECDLSIKNMALMRHWSEKSIIKAVNNLKEKTKVFSKVIYRDKGSCIKKTKYIITDDSVKILNDYIKKNMPIDFDEKKEKLKNRSVLAMERIENEKQSLNEKQQEILKAKSIENEMKNQNETDFKNDDYRKSNDLLSAWLEIINAGYFETDEDFINHKKRLYNLYFDYVPEEKQEEKIDVRLSDLKRFTDNLKTMDVFNTLIKNGKMIGRQPDNVLMSLKMDFGFQRNFERINIICE